jgi:5-methylcytosine-specific restriction endonuclease McrA
MRAYYARRFFWGRAMKLRGENRATFRDLARIWKNQRGRCALTGRRLDRTAQLDHVLAKARGGTDEASNLRWLCKAANLARREFSDDEFFTLCFDVVRMRGAS